MQIKDAKYYPEDAKKLRAFLYHVPHCEYNAMRKKIVEACMIQHYTLANWLSGNARIPPLAKQKIEEVTGQHIF